MTERLRLIAAVVLVSGLGACTVFWPDVAQVELQRSLEQALIIENDTGVPVVIEPQASDAKALRLEAGSQATLNFVVLTTAQMTLVEERMTYRVTPAAVRSAFVADRLSELLGRSGSDWTLRVRKPEQPAVRVLLSLEGCPGGGWGAHEAPASPHKIKLEDVSSIIPKRICPAKK